MPHYVAQANLKLVAIFLSQSLNAGITGMCHHSCPGFLLNLTLITLCLVFDSHVKFLEAESCMSSLQIYPQNEFLDTVQGTLALVDTY